jgi:hypothetical protein
MRKKKERAAVTVITVTVVKQFDYTKNHMRTEGVA